MGAGRGAAGKVELETAFGQDLRLEARDQRRRPQPVIEALGDERQRLVDRLVRVALGQESRARTPT